MSAAPCPRSALKLHINTFFTLHLPAWLVYDFSARPPISLVPFDYYVPCLSLSLFVQIPQRQLSVQKYRQLLVESPHNIETTTWLQQVDKTLLVVVF